MLLILSVTMFFVSCTTDTPEEKGTYTVVTKLPSDDSSSKVGSTRIECYHDGVLVNTTICHDDACIEWAINNCVN